MVEDVNGLGIVTEISGVLDEPVAVEDGFVVAADHGLKISWSEFLTELVDDEGLLEEEKILVLCLCALDV